MTDNPSWVRLVVVVSRFGFLLWSRVDAYSDFLSMADCRPAPHRRKSRLQECLGVDKTAPQYDSTIASFDKKQFTCNVTVNIHFLSFRT